MAEEIKYNIIADTSQAQKSFSKMEDSVKGLDKSLDKGEKGLKDVGKAADSSKNKLASLGGLIKQGFGLGIGIKLFDTFSQKLMENERVAKLFEAAMNVVKGVINGVVEVIGPAIDWMAKLFKEPKVWWDDLVDSLKRGGQWIKDNLIDLVLNKFVEWANNAQIAVLNLRKAWNEFTNDTEEAAKITQQITDLQNQNIELAKQNAKKVENIKTVVNDVVEFTKKAVTTIGKNIKNVTDNQDFLLTYEKNLGRLQRAYQRIATEAEIEAEKTRQRRDDENVSIQDRIKANQELAVVLEKNKQKEIAAQESIIAHMQKELSIKKRNAELSNRIEEEKLKLFEIENKYTGQLSEQLSNINGLRNEEFGILKTTADAKQEVYKMEVETNAELERNDVKRLQMQIDNVDLVYNKKVEALDKELALAKEGTARYAEIQAERMVVDAEYTNNKKKLSKDLAMAEKAQQYAQLDATKTFLAGAQALFKENSKAAVAASIGQAVIDTYVAANKVLSDPLVPFPFNIVAAAGMVATGLANVKKIYEASSKMGVDTGGGVGGGSTGGPSIGVVGGQVDSSTQVARSVQGAIGGPQKAYVVGNDVTSRQSLDRRISQNATLGG
jgi:hypothetical protein